MQTHHITVKGKVQGVFFRATAKKKATSLQLVGWVKNTAKGTVEIMASGSGEKLVEFEQWCRSGPPKAEVEDVLVEVAPTEFFDSFSILK